MELIFFNATEKKKKKKLVTIYGCATFYTLVVFDRWIKFSLCQLKIW